MNEKVRKTACDVLNIVRTRAHAFDFFAPCRSTCRCMHELSLLLLSLYKEPRRAFKAKMVYQWARDPSGARNESIKASSQGNISRKTSIDTWFHGTFWT
jgi:hypothetical protein